MHIFYAQGGGLGHLTRIDKLIKTLKLPAKDVIIITPSVFTKYFDDYAFILLSWNDAALRWTNTIKKVLHNTTITTFYIDTFPFGLKGELITIYETFPKLKYIYISRLLKWEKYLNAIPDTIPIIFSKTILLESLYPEHLNWITDHSQNVSTIQLKTKKLIPINYSEEPYVLIVHSGGKVDVLHLCNQAIKDHQFLPGIKIVVFTQVDIQLEHPDISIHKNVYPVSMYFDHAKKIYTAAGFNMIHELKHYNEKHVIIAFNKLFDDQFFRKTNNV